MSCVYVFYILGRLKRSRQSLICQPWAQHYRKPGEPAMADIEIYSSPICGFCYRAKSLLAQKGASFSEIDVLMDSGRKKEMMSRAGGRHTVPQIFINDIHVGGCDELYALDRNGDLDRLLSEDALS